MRAENAILLHILQNPYCAIDVPVFEVEDISISKIVITEQQTNPKKYWDGGLQTPYNNYFQNALSQLIQVELYGDCH